MKVVLVLLVVAAVRSQELPAEWKHFNKFLDCNALGFRGPNQNDPARRYYFLQQPMLCGIGTRFSMAVCTCITDQRQVVAISSRPFCERILNVTGTEDLQVSNNNHRLEYTGDTSSIFRNQDATCYRNSYFSIPYLESNDYGNSMNIRFSVRFTNIDGVNNNNNNNAETIILMSNGNCGKSSDSPTLRIGYNPANDSYIFLADRFFQTCRMTPRRSITNRNIIDVVDWRFTNGALSVTVNDQLINRSGCTVNVVQNIFAAFNYKLKGTVCPMRIGNAGGRVADVCLSNIQMNRDCAPGM